VHNDVIVAAEILYGRIRGLNGTGRDAMRESGLCVSTVALLFPLDAITVDNIPKGTRTHIHLFDTLCNYWNPTIFRPLPCCSKRMFSILVPCSHDYL
jgi:hypothetical protein